MGHKSSHDGGLVTANRGNEKTSYESRMPSDSVGVLEEESAIFADNSDMVIRGFGTPRAPIVPIDPSTLDCNVKTFGTAEPKQ